MNRSERIPVLVVSGLLLLYIFLIATSSLPVITGIIFSVSPLLVVWLAYNVVRFGNSVKELKDGDEWGYADKSRDEPGMV
ncbi:MAG: hypothetical protein JNJ86_12525 [Chitinophagaceae bacterium]|nr:hypothetical protein [Chitinophagaceae bacterium]